MNIEEELKKFLKDARFRKWIEDVLLHLTTTPPGQIDSLIPGMMQNSQ